jgi:hypothetical protein
MASTNKTMTTMIKIVTRLIEPFPLVRVSGAQSSRCARQSDARGRR